MINCAHLLFNGQPAPLLGAGAGRISLKAASLKEEG